MKIKYKIASFLQVVTVCNSAIVDAPSQNIYPAAAARPSPEMKANIPACVAAGVGGAGAWLVCVTVTSSAEQQPGTQPAAGTGHGRDQIEEETAIFPLKSKGS